MTAQPGGFREAWDRARVLPVEGVGPALARETALALGEIRDRIVEGAELRPGMRAVDLGAGGGLLAFGAADEIAPGHALTLDPDPALLARVSAIAGYAGVSLVAASPTRTPLPAACAQGVLWRGLFGAHTARAILAEARRLLPSGGRVSFAEPLLAEFQIADATPGLEAAWNAVRDGAAGSLGDRLPGFEDLGAFLERAGFDDVRVQREARRTRLPDGRAVRAFLSGRPPGQVDVAGALGMPDDDLVREICSFAPLTLLTPEAYGTARRAPEA